MAIFGSQNPLRPRPPHCTARAQHDTSSCIVFLSAIACQQSTSARRRATTDNHRQPQHAPMRENGVAARPLDAVAACLTDLTGVPIRPYLSPKVRGWKKTTARSPNVTRHAHSLIQTRHQRYLFGSGHRRSWRLRTRGRCCESNRHPWLNEAKSPLVRTPGALQSESRTLKPRAGHSQSAQPRRARFILHIWLSFTKSQRGGKGACGRYRVCRPCQSCDKVTANSVVCCCAFTEFQPLR